MLRLIAAALVAMGCSSEAGTRVLYLERDGGAGDHDAAASVPPGGACESTTECAPTAWPGVVDPEVGCVDGVCTFACAGNAGVTAKCEELGGACSFVAGQMNACVWPAQ